MVKQQTFVAKQRGGMDVILHPIISPLKILLAWTLVDANNGRVGISLMEEA